VQGRKFHGQKKKRENEGGLEGEGKVSLLDEGVAKGKGKKISLGEKKKVPFITSYNKGHLAMALKKRKRKC